MDHVRETLCDGEMVMDVVNGVNTPRFLIYDTIMFNGNETGKIDFQRRLGCIQNEIVMPRYEAIAKKIIDRQQEPFGVRLKDFWPVENCEKILNGKFQLPHEPDGVIFQPLRDPYECGRCDAVLKWKPPELNTIDFRLKVCRLTGEGILPTRVGELYVGQLATPFGVMRPLPKAVAELDGKIIECNFDGKSWCFLRERTDKSFPNAYSTAQAVAFSIAHPVRKDYLLHYIARNGYKESSMRH
jgi:mRNA-capping enzyme